MKLRNILQQEREREIYNKECTAVKEKLAKDPLNPSIIHISFDNAQQIYYQQVGPLYFLTPRKYQIFGVCNEAKSEQMINENDIAGRGANTVVSMLHHYFDAYNVTAGQEVLLHADNAVGQNKNNCVMQYLCWRILTGRNCKIKISFMVAGHTKFHWIAFSVY